MEKRIYFKNLNGLRFIAATLVIFHHIEQYKWWAKLPNVWGNTAITAIGQKAVSFFFVLSGFLITYLLLVENKQSGSINVRNFYIRRILRIWPLYYLIVLLSLFVLPLVFDFSAWGINVYENNFGAVSILLLLVLPNVVRLFQPTIIGGNQLWSIGVEEQFYLVWPLLVKKFINRIIIFLIVLIILKILITFGLVYWVWHHPVLILRKTLRFWQLLQVEQMAIGAIGAWMLYQRKEKLLSMLYHPVTHYLSLAMVIVLVVVPFHHWMITYAEALVFMVVIMNLSTNPALRFNMEGVVFSTLGNISYGIYMYHGVCITVCLFTLSYLHVDQMNPVLFNSILYVGAVVLTVSVAYFSYEMFEKKFLDLKEHFMVVKSGTEAQAPVAQRQRATVVAAYWRLLIRKLSGFGKGFF
jgi:peptidoglycan/LPS O-acetylase OafA/YrhL